MTTHFVPKRSYQRLIGREAEVREIMARLSSQDNRTPVVAVEGIGGLGKTALAHEVAWRYVEEREYLPPDARFDTIIWAAARPESSSSEENSAHLAFTALNDVFRAVAMALEIPTLMQVAPEERPMQCWAALHQYRRVLLVVDNLEEDDDDSISGFLRDLPDGTRALVTTRFHENLPRPCRLGPLQFPAARELVAAECSSKGLVITSDQLDSLARVSQGMPLVARLVVGLCVANGIEAVVRSRDEIQMSLSSDVFTRSIAPLEQQYPAAYQCLLSFALFDSVAGATGSALAACLGVDVASAGKARSRLEYLNLVQPAQASLGGMALEGGGEGLDKALREHDTSERYIVLPLVHEYARRELGRNREWLTGAKVRLVGYYRQVASALDDPAHYNAAVMEAPNLIGVMRHLADSMEINRLADLFGASQEFLYARSSWDELLEFSARILDFNSQTRAAPAPQTLVALLQAPVDIYRRRGEMNGRGAAWVSAIQALAGRLRDRMLEAEIHLARCRLLCNDETLAATWKLTVAPKTAPHGTAGQLELHDPDFVEDVKRDIRVFETAGRSDRVFLALLTLGNFYRVCGIFDRAERRYREALAILTENPPRTPAWQETRIALVRASQALVAGRMGRLDEACETLSTARVALVDIVDRVEADTARAYYEYQRGNRDKALALRTAAVAAKVKLGLRGVPLCLEDAQWDEEVSPSTSR